MGRTIFKKMLHIFIVENAWLISGNCIQTKTILSFSLFLVTIIMHVPLITARKSRKFIQSILCELHYKMSHHFFPVRQETKVTEKGNLSILHVRVWISSNVKYIFTMIQSLFGCYENQISLILVHSQLVTNCLWFYWILIGLWPR